MPQSDIQLQGEIELQPRISDKQQILGLKSWVDKNSDILTDALTRNMFSKIKRGEAATGIGARTNFMREYGLRYADLKPQAKRALDIAATGAERMRRAEIKHAKEMTWTPAKRIFTGVGTKEDFKFESGKIQNQLEMFRKGGTTAREYATLQSDASRLADVVVSEIQNLEASNPELKKRGNKVDKEIKGMYNTLKKISKNLTEVQKTAKENSVKIRRESSKGGLPIGRTLGAIAGGLGTAISKFVLPGLGKSIKEGDLRYIYAGMDTALTATGKSLKGETLESAIRSTQMTASDFAMKEKWGQVSGMEYNALSALSRASGLDMLSLIRNASSGDENAMRKLNNAFMTAHKGMRADEWRFYMRQAGFDPNLALYNKAFEEDAESAMKTVGSAYTNERARRDMEKTSNNLYRTGRRVMDTAISRPGTALVGAAAGVGAAAIPGIGPIAATAIGSSLSTAGAIGATQLSTVVSGNTTNITVNTSGNLSATEVAEKVKDVADKTLWQQFADKIKGEAK